MTGRVAMDIRSEIEELARSAEREYKERLEATRPRPPRRFHLTWVIWLGGALALLEAGLLGYQLAMREAPTLSGAVAPHPLLTEQSCAGARYRTLRALITYHRDTGRWPATLGDLVGPYLAEAPTDPQTGLPLMYAAEGQNLTLECATLRARAR